MRMTQQYTHLNNTKNLLLIHWNHHHCHFLTTLTLNNNFMKANGDKSHILLSCSEPSTALIDGSSIESNTK